METVVIEDKCVREKRFIRHARALSFAAAVTEKKMSFEEACKECNAVSVKTFTDELRRQIHKHFDEYA